MMEDKIYTDEEVTRIIRRALKLDRSGSITHGELMETAGELGIDPKAIQAAIELEQAQSDRERMRAEWLKRRRSKFHRHLWSYIVVNAGLLLINLITGGPWWFQWPLLGWGIGLAFNLRAAYFPGEEEIERGIRKTTARLRK